jgi:hypothetical protein
MDFMKTLWGSEREGTALGSCLMVGLGINVVVPSGSDTTVPDSSGKITANLNEI